MILSPQSAGTSFSIGDPAVAKEFAKGSVEGRLVESKRRFAIAFETEIRSHVHVSIMHAPRECSRPLRYDPSGLKGRDFGINTEDISLDQPRRTGAMGPFQRIFLKII
jgi:hypothetical protein